MGYIYIIKNTINNKVYIGKTNQHITKRFKEHIRDSRKLNLQHRPLYKAMRKYGSDNFYIELLEETQDTAIREQFWIEKFNSFHYGYNATKGGDGTEYIDRELIIQEYQKYQTINKVSQETGHDIETIRNILNNAGVTIFWNKENTQKIKGRHVKQIDINTGETIAVYITLTDAAKQLHLSNKAGLQKALRSKRKYAYGYLWQTITYEEYEQYTRNNNS